MELAQLRTYLELARRHSFVAAARALGVSQPAVTRQVQALERELGVNLVHRGGTAIVLTPLILREPGSGTMRTVEALLTARGEELPRESVRMVLGSSSAVVAAVEDGLGLGFVSSLAVAGERRHRDVAAVRLGGLRFLRHLYLACDETQASAPIVQAFIDHLDEWRTCRGEAVDCREQK